MMKASRSGPDIARILIALSLVCGALVTPLLHAEATVADTYPHLALNYAAAVLGSNSMSPGSVGRQ
jgi:hypothetical protein